MGRRRHLIVKYASRSIHGCVHARGLLLSLPAFLEELSTGKQPFLPPTPDAAMKPEAREQYYDEMGKKLIDDYAEDPVKWLDAQSPGVSKQPWFPLLRCRRPYPHSIVKSPSTLPLSKSDLNDAHTVDIEHSLNSNAGTDACDDAIVADYGRVVCPKFMVVQNDEEAAQAAAGVRVVGRRGVRSKSGRVLREEGEEEISADVGRQGGGGVLGPLTHVLVPHSGSIISSSEDVAKEASHCGPDLPEERIIIIKLPVENLSSTDGVAALVRSDASFQVLMGVLIIHLTKPENKSLASYSAKSHPCPTLSPSSVWCTMPSTASSRHQCSFESIWCVWVLLVDDILRADKRLNEKVSKMDAHSNGRLFTSQNAERRCLELNKASSTVGSWLFGTPFHLSDSWKVNADDMSLFWSISNKRCSQAVFPTLGLGLGVGKDKRSSMLTVLPSVETQPFGLISGVNVVSEVPCAGVVEEFDSTKHIRLRQCFLNLAVPMILRIPTQTDKRYTLEAENGEEELEQKGLKAKQMGVRAMMVEHRFQVLNHVRSSLAARLRASPACLL
ncbi:hypothetical protein BDK51DRAFT_43930 [Blyttiomyces helicus]|uniref:Uncharacterized protein n=1 Tax=Blyttiomyces helicus TaxID=388810 RepID=A0A4P9WJ64_9FUNG|nr:hypothetical protein BDK51DRAFT_43930 [Blyttiomyces helicus]|eukprot:RKO91518.1 hypothetical protein BDK51DRAFT_43930 [Blyttiomyces helicus]